MEALTEISNFPGRRDDFKSIDLVSRRPILHGPVTAGIGGPVAADTAAVAAARVTGIEKAPFTGFLLYRLGNDAGFYDHVHSRFINF